jgi:hypothetical protein
MDENRWPRPGLGMVVMFAVVGLIGGILAGLFNPAGSRQHAGQGVSDQRSDGSTTTTELPASFYTVVLASIARARDRSEAEARAEAFRAEGVRPVGVLDPRRYRSLSDNWAVYSGVYEHRRDAEKHRDELRNRGPDLANAYLKHVTS